MNNLHRFGCLVAAALSVGAFAAPAAAQSTGSRTVEGDVGEADVVVTGVRTEGIDGIVVTRDPKARQTLTQEQIGRQRPGASILDTINLVPGVSFQGNDPYGGAGGSLTIRGFDSSRVSLTFDGIPLNDSGNYAIYSNQQLDPELIERVSVNLGSTDVDSPTASATGGTVNYRTRDPKKKLGAMLDASIGTFDYHRVFGSIDTGELTRFGTRAFVTASYQTNDSFANGEPAIDKQQYNGKILQPLSGDDFLAVAVNYNQNRNRFFASVPLRLDGGRVVGPDAANRFPFSNDELPYSIAPCATAAARPGLADVANACGSLYDYRYNPSNNGNVRGNARFTLAHDLVLTVDPSYQWVKANGGGTAVATEAAGRLVGYGAAINTGVDLNGDGDLLDAVRVLAPSNTQTRRFGVIANLIWDVGPDHRLRLSYTWDHARHRQTGEIGRLDQTGSPVDYFGGRNDPIRDSNGATIQKRDRLSYAVLNQVAGEYRGTLLDDRLIVAAGLRVPFFRRSLEQSCYTRNASGGVLCTAAPAATVLAQNPGIVAPRSAKFDYSKALPNAGVSFKVTGAASVFADYSRGLTVPSTDNLYNGLFFATPANAQPETTDSFDLGLRWTTTLIQAQATGWYTRFRNRTAAAYDVDLGETVYRNLGTVDKYGVDGSIAVRPVRPLALYAFGSYLKSRIRDDIQTGAGQFAATAGRRESGAPVYTFGGRAQADWQGLSVGVQYKRTGRRYFFDDNQPVQAIVGGARAQVFAAAAPAYDSLDLDARFSLARFGMKDTYIQLNATNLLDSVVVGSYTGGLTQTATRNAAGAVTAYTVPFVQVGAPRAVSATISVGF